MAVTVVVLAVIVALASGKLCVVDESGTGSIVYPALELEKGARTLPLDALDHRHGAAIIRVRSDENVMLEL